MFRLLRYFSLTAGIALVAVAIILIIFYRQTAIQDLVDITERQNVALARSFANAIWPNYAPYVASVTGLDGDTLRARAETGELHDILKALSAELPVLKAKIYNLEGLTVYSSETAQIGDDKSGNPGFAAAAGQGIPASKLIERGTFSAFEGVINEHRDLVESYLPIRGEDGRIEGVFELYSDVTPLVARIGEITRLLLAGVIIVFGALYGVLLLIVWRADRVLRRQYDELQGGEKTLLETNTRLEQEVTERRYAEKELRRARDELETRVEERTPELREANEALRFTQFSVDNASDPIMWIRPGGQIIEVNKALCKALGYTREEFKTMMVSDIDPNVAAPDWPERWEAIKASGSYIFESVHKARDGSLIPVEIAINHLDYEGEKFLNVFIRDLTERKRAEAELRVSEEKFSKAFLASPDAIVISSIDEGTIIDVNDVFLERTGYTREEAIGRPVRDYGLWVDPDLRDTYLKTVVEHGECRDFEVVIRDKKGRLRTTLLSGRLIEIDGAVRVLSISRDITERKRVEQALQTSEEKFSKAFLASPDMIIISRLRDGKIIDCNDAFSRISGYARDEVIGKTTLEFSAWADPADREAYATMLEQHGVCHELEAPFRAKDGHVMPALISGRLIELNNDICVISIARDITERKQMEEALRESEKYYRSLYENAPVMMHSVGRDGRLTRVNDAWLKTLGYETDEVMGRRCVEFLTPESRSRAEAIYFPALVEDGGISDVSFTYVKKTGKTVEASLSAFAEYDEHGEMEQSVAVITDLTERIHMEDALRDSEEYYRTLYENAPVMMHTLDRDRNLTRVNEAWLETLGYTREEVIGRKSTDFLAPESRERALSVHIPEMLEKGQVFDVPYTYVKKNGETVEALLSSFVERSEKGDVLRSVAVIIDITERKRAEEALRENEKFLQSVIDEMPANVWVKDDEQRFLLVNRDMAHWLEANPEDLVGKTAEQCGMRNAGQYEGLDRQIIDSGETLPAFETDGEGDGGVHTWLETKAPIKDGQGRVKYVVGTAVDITERKNMERELERSETRLVDAQRIAQLGNWERDIESGRSFWSDGVYQILGLEPHGVEPSHEAYLERIYPEDRERHKEALAQAYQQWDPMTLEYRILLPNGEVRDIHERNQATIDGEGKAVRLTGTIQDITGRKRIEEELRRSEASFVNAQRIAKLGSWNWNLLTGEQYGSESAFSILGLSPDERELTHETYLELVHPDDRSKLEGALNRSLQQTDPVSIEYRIRLPGGGERTVYETNEASFDASGKAVSLTGTVLDITERKRIEQELERSEASLVNAQHIARLGSWEWDLISEDSIWSDEMYAVLGLSLGEVTPSFKTFIARVLPEDRHKVTEADDQALGQHDPVSVEYRIELPGGEERIIYERKQAKRDAAGEAVSLAGILQDITERKRIEQELARSEASLVNAQRIARLGSWEWDIKSKKAIWSDQVYAVLGLEPGEVTPSFDTFIQRVHPDDKKVSMDADDRALGQRDPVSVEYRIELPGGEERIIHERRQAKQDAAGKPLSLAGILHDVTEQRRAEEEMRKAMEQSELANRTKSEFLANMSHELRTPLNAIIGFSEILSRQIYGEIGSPKYLDYAKDINHSGTHLLELINDILDLSKIEAGRIELHEENIDVARVVASCLTLVSGRAQTNGVSLDYRLPDHLPMLRADKRKLKQIMLNLLSNAVKFTPKGGRVVLDVTADKERGLVIRINDTGVGIRHADLARVMDPFYQVDSKLNRKYEGTGLGLSLTRSLVDLHDGRMELDSETGRGTTVTVSFGAKRLRERAA